MLRVANVRSEAVLEGVRDALDLLGVDYEFIRSEPGEGPSRVDDGMGVDGSADDVDNIMQRLSEEHGFDAELL